VSNRAVLRGGVCHKIAESPFADYPLPARYLVFEFYSPTLRRQHQRSCATI